jgi:hypothetical protein
MHAKYMTIVSTHFQTFYNFKIAMYNEYVLYNVKATCSYITITTTKCRLRFKKCNKIDIFSWKCCQKVQQKLVSDILK